MAFVFDELTPYDTCFDDIAELTTNLPAGIKPAYKPSAGGPHQVIDDGSLGNSTTAIRLGVERDTTLHPNPVAWKRQSSGAPEVSSSITPGVQAHRVDVQSLIEWADQEGAAGEAVSFQDEDVEECEVDGNGEPSGDPGEDYEAGSCRFGSVICGWAARFVAFSSRNYQYP